jgi:hypothetical protein
MALKSLVLGQNNKTSLKSIPLLPIEPKFWHPTNQKVKSTFGEYRNYNKIIEQTIDDLKANKKFNEDNSKRAFTGSFFFFLLK